MNYVHNLSKETSSEENLQVQDQTLSHESHNVNSATSGEETSWSLSGDYLGLKPY